MQTEHSTWGGPGSRRARRGVGGSGADTAWPDARRGHRRAGSRMRRVSRRRERGQRRPMPMVEARAALRAARPSRPRRACCGPITSTSSVCRSRMARSRVIFPDIPNNYRVRAELGMPLLHGADGSRHSSRPRVRGDGGAADRRMAVADVSLEVGVSYWTLVTARERVRVLERALQRADAMVSDARGARRCGPGAAERQSCRRRPSAHDSASADSGEERGGLAEAQLARLVGAPAGRANLAGDARRSADAGRGHARRRVGR